MFSAITNEINNDILELEKQISEKDLKILFSHSKESDVQYRTSLKRRLTYEPLPYILGHIKFYGFDFLIDNK